jgi:hypothetical protein
MRTHTLVILLALVGAVGPSACDKKEEAPDAKKAEAKQDARPTEAKADVKAEAKTEAKPEAKAEPDDDFSDAAPVAGGVIELAKLGLRAQGAADAKVSDAFVGEGVTVLGTTLMATVEPAAEDRPKAEAEAKKQAEGTYTGVRAWKAEALPDGFAATFENEGDLGTNYFVSARRELGGKAYWCSTTVASPEEQAAALAFCKSLATP